jgi:hypothetical protein
MFPYEVMGHNLGFWIADFGFVESLRSINIIIDRIP